MVSVHEIPLFCNSSTMFIKFSGRVLEESTEMRAFLLQISKAFERVAQHGQNDTLFDHREPQKPYPIPRHIPL